MKNKKVELFLVFFLLLLLSGLISLTLFISSQERINEKGKFKPPGERPLCTSDLNCQKGFSCWYKIPAGPAEGEKGSRENPGICRDNEVINTIL